jgi:hypothetical protein
VFTQRFKRFCLNSAAADGMCFAFVASARMSSGLIETFQFGFAFAQVRSSSQSSSMIGGFVGDVGRAMNAKNVSSTSAPRGSARVVVLLAARRDRIVAGGRDLERERLPARAGRRLHDVDQVAIDLSLWNSSMTIEMRIEAVFRVRAERLELLLGVRPVHVLRVDLDLDSFRPLEVTSFFASLNTNIAWRSFVARQ